MSEITILQSQLNRLRNDLDLIVLNHCGEQVLQQVIELRIQAESIRNSYTKEAYEKLKIKVNKLEAPMRQQVIRAFSIYMQLVSIAEHNERIHNRRASQDNLEDVPHTIENAVQFLKSHDIQKEKIQEMINQLSLELVITAHPTEASRRTVLEIRKRIAVILMQLDEPQLSLKRKERLEESLFNEITVLWQTDELRHKKPVVMDEVRHGLRYFEETLFDVLPDVHQDLESHLSKVFPDFKWDVPNFLKFGSWIGGDRDGNPFVTAEVTWKTMHIQRDIVLRKYVEVTIELMKRFSHSMNRTKIEEDFIARVEEAEKSYLTPDKIWPVQADIYRRMFAVILERLNNVGQSERGYASHEEFLTDLDTILESVKKHHSKQHELKALRKLIRQVDLFGFHLVSLDIRNHSGEHEAAIDELLEKVKITESYHSLPEDEKVSILQKLLEDPRPVMLVHEQYSKETEELFNTFKTIKNIHDQFGKRAIDVYLISKAQSESDVLEVLLLCKEAGIYRLKSNGTVESDLNVAPLLETIDDLVAGPNIMKNLFEMDVYQKHLKEHGFNQEIMIGYSDGSKDGGTVAAHWKLYKAQQEIYYIAKPHGINLKFFHGRGGSLGRGGGPLSRTLLSKPIEMYGKHVKMTEQGEVLSSRYLIPELAYANLEEAIATLLKASAKSLHADERKVTWEKAMDEISEYALEKYQSLVLRDDDFFTYFKEATPLIEVGALNIGSRPISRKNSARFEDLRAIPWVFSWSQCRQFFPAWFAAGTGLATFTAKSKKNEELIKEMYVHWHFFRVMVQNLYIAITKADVMTAKEYQNLVEDENLRDRIFSDIFEEYEKTKEMVEMIMKDSTTDDTRTIKGWIEQRNPYLLPLNLIQVDLIKQMRVEEENKVDVLTDILLTISGIAAGIRNTG